MKSFRLSDIAKEIDGVLYGQDIEVKGVASLKSAKEGDITFLFVSSYLEEAVKSPASAFVVIEGLQVSGKSYIVVKNGSLAQAKLLKLFYPEEKKHASLSVKSTISKTAVIQDNVTVMDFAFIGENTTVGEGTVIYPFVYIGNNVKIGRNVKIFPHVVLMDDTEVGDNVILYPGSVIGSDGFGYAFDGVQYVKIPQVGKVVIENNVEIGANTTIDRAAMDETRVGAGTKIDNQVMVGHNVNIGKNCVFAAQVGIAGSCNIGNYVVMGGKVGLNDHINIGDGVQIGGMSGVLNDVEKGKKIVGIPAISYIKWLKVQSIIKKLPELKKELDNLSNLVKKEEQK